MISCSHWGLVEYDDLMCDIKLLVTGYGVGRYGDYGLPCEWEEQPCWLSLDMDCIDGI